MIRSFAVEESPALRFLIADTRMAPFWLLVRLAIGWEWLHAGWVKVTNAAWFGFGAGAPIVGFVNGALAKTSGLHPDVQGWYAAFLEACVLPNPALWANLVSVGELLVGLALILGFLTAISAFWGTFMSVNFLLAGTVSINPFLTLGGIALMLAWRIAGEIGLDRWVLPLIDRKLAARERSVSAAKLY